MTSPLPSPPPAVDLYTQALKSLSVWSPNDPKDFGSRSTNLPIRIARELIKISDTKKKHKKSSSLGHGERANDLATFGNAENSKSEEKSSSLWEKMEVYFRAVQESDIESLMHKGLDKSLFSIPFLERQKVEFQENASLNGNEAVQEKNIERMELDSVDADTNLVLMPEVVADRITEVRAVNEEKEEEEQEASECAYSSWVLHSQKRTILSQRPKKKRKQYGNEAGLKLLLKLPHSEKSASIFCDVCYMRIENVKSDNVISCNTCHISVHKKCYGLHRTEEQPWSCYQCNNLEGKGSCMLCPKSVGALKPVSGNYKIEEEKKYAHLFCCMWNPETYIKDMETMEPVMKVGVVHDIRRNYVCNACEVKSGVCVRCSIGTCRTTFHPICAREARYQMEIWRKVGCADVELRAYCPKHSTPPEVPMPLPSKPSKLKIKRKGDDIIQDSIEQTGFKEKTKAEASLESLKNADMPSSININVEVPENEQITDTPSLISVFNKLVSQGESTVGDIASEVDISPALLDAILKDESSSFSPELRLKMIKLLQESSNGSVISLGAAAVDFSNDVEVSTTLNVGSCSVEQLRSLDKMNNKPVALTEDRKISPLGENVLQTLKGESANVIGKVSRHTEGEKVVVGKTPHILASTKSKDKALKKMATKDSQYTHTSPSLNSDQVRSSEVNDLQLKIVLQRMSYMRGDLLKKTRKLVKGLAIPSPTWLKAMEMASPVEPSQKVGKKKKTEEYPEDVYVRKFVKMHPNSTYHDAVRMNKSDPPSSRIFAWRVLELKDEGVNEEDAMALADVEYRQEKAAKKAAYKELKKISRILGKEPPPNPYPSAMREIQTEERKYVSERFYNREILEIVQKMKEEKAAALQARGLTQPQLNQFPGGRGGQGGAWQQQGPPSQRTFGEGQLSPRFRNIFGSGLK